MSLSLGEEFTRVHSPSAMWVQSMTTRGFKVCTRETGFGTNGTGVVNWLAFQSHPQIIQGSVTIDGVWTTQSKCNNVAFKQVSKKLIHRPEQVKTVTEVALIRDHHYLYGRRLSSRNNRREVSKTII